MNKLKMKARAGVTLVELLVVILIITILSVSLLPLLKPYIEESKYAAEAQPTLANVQTKINLFQYEKDKLPCASSQDDDKGFTWMTNTSASAGSVISYVPARITYSSQAVEKDSSGNHLQDEIKVDWQDLLGRRMNPTHFQYHLIKGDGAAKYGYAVGVFGDGNGLGKGTGYAVLTLVDTTTNKVIATWSRYKPENDVKLSFKAGPLAEANKKGNYVWLPKQNILAGSDWETILQGLKRGGWDFQNIDKVTTTP